MCKIVILLFIVVAVVNCSNEGFNVENDDKIIPFRTDEESIRLIHSIMDAYRGDVLGERLVIETDALIDTNYYNTRKRNGDIINSILALPKGMNDAGR